MTATKFDVIVLGAGAAGMMCAFEAGRRARRVLLLDHGEKVGRKILISGGGRCNFSNLGAKAENFLSANPHFAKSALARFTPQDFIALVEKHSIRYHEKTLGQLFCDGNAREIVTMLEKECAEAGVETRCGVSVLSVAKPDAEFVVETSNGTLIAASVVIATGGLSIPKMGATGFGYNVAKHFGHTLVETRPALVGLTFTPEDRNAWCEIAGLSTEVIGKALLTQKKPPPKFREAMLITHRGVSGPAVLQVSSYWKPGANVQFDLAPGHNVFGPLLASTAGRDWNAAFAALRNVIPTRMAERWIRLRANTSAGDWTNAGIQKLEVDLHAWTFTPAGTDGYEKAEVTVGGISTDELDARTLESKRVPGLYFIGEVVDVTGWLGGYNFQWAWASAVSAGRNA